MLPVSRPVPRASLGWWQDLTSARGQEHIAVQVRDVMTEVTVTDSTTDTLRSAAERMRRQQTGSLLVMEGGRLAGILTERDVLRAVAAASAWSMSRPAGAGAAAGPHRARRPGLTAPRRGGQGSSNGREMPSRAC